MGNFLGKKAPDRCSYCRLEGHDLTKCPVRRADFSCALCGVDGHSRLTCPDRLGRVQQQQQGAAASSVRIPQRSTVATPSSTNVPRSTATNANAAVAPPAKCLYCHQQGHDHTVCHFRCYLCGRYGHSRLTCPTRLGPASSSTSVNGQQQQRATPSSATIPQRSTVATPSTTNPPPRPLPSHVSFRDPQRSNTTVAGSASTAQPQRSGPTSSSTVANGYQQQRAAQSSATSSVRIPQRSTAAIPSLANARTVPLIRPLTLPVSRVPQRLPTTSTSTAPTATTAAVTAASATCKYCKKPDHEIKDCQKLKKVKCPLCGQNGHTQNWCRRNGPTASGSTGKTVSNVPQPKAKKNAVVHPKKDTRPNNVLPTGANLPVGAQAHKRNRRRKSRVRKNANNVQPAKAKPKGPVFECSTCFEEYPIADGRILCTDFFKAGTRKGRHPVCVDCIRSWAKAAIGEAMLPPGGIGLKCVEAGCQNVILFNHFQQYLQDTDHTALSKRLQSECIAAAKSDDFVTCSRCGVTYVYDKFHSVFVCECGFRQCRRCNTAYHPSQTCEDVMKELRRANKIDDIVVRKCTRCHAQFIKESGCNHMTCRCGQHYCYLCHKAISGYDHFCQCNNVNLNGRPCPQCRKTCLVHESADVVDQRRIELLA